MRKDMNKVLTTPPRYGGRRGAKDNTYDKMVRSHDKRFVPGRRDVIDEFSPKKESMRKRHQMNGEQNLKVFSDHLGPLMRYLEAQVGRKWDDVWSDICKVLKGNGVSAQHVKGHVKQAVGGIPHVGETYFDDDDWFQPGAYYRGGVYVNEQGIVCKNQAPARREQVVFDHVQESDSVEYHKINGAWTRCKRVPVEEEASYLDWQGKTKHRRLPVYYVTEKKTLSKKEIRDLDLANRLSTREPRIKP